jgi:hypothetical protein
VNVPRTEIVASRSMRLVVQPGPADVRCRGMLEKFLLEGVLAEPADRAQPPGDRGPDAAFRLEFAGEGLDVGAADGEQGQGPCAASGG